MNKYRAMCKMARKDRYIMGQCIRPLLANPAEVRIGITGISALIVQTYYQGQENVEWAKDKAYTEVDRLLMKMIGAHKTA